MFERVKDKEGKEIALIVYSDFDAKGITFFTENHLSQQLAYMSHPKGKQILPHVHNPVPREVKYTQEVLFIKKGKLRVDFYNNDQSYLESRILKEGDIILLAEGGHGFEALEELQMIEVKQGPYAGDMDKTRFEPIDRSKVIIKE
jgi:mannose-6-phosphate isomerase-like protein (cupin superfamily)